MCLGAQAKAANETARRNYEYQLNKREADWMQTLSLTRAEHVQHQHTVNNQNLGLANVYGEIHAKHGQLIDEVLRKDEDNWKNFLKNSESAKLVAGGATGKSIDRISSLDLGNYLAQRNRMAAQLTSASEELQKQGGKAAGSAKAAIQQSFVKQAFIKSPGFAPPAPVYQNVGMAAFQDALSIGSSIASMAMPFATAAASDRKLKENIKKIGESISGLGIYKFNYIGQTQKWIGTMADEVKKIKPEAVFRMKNGFQGVRYDLIDVKMRRAI